MAVRSAGTFADSCKMGSFVGHVAPGTIFLFIANWWFIGEILQKREANRTLRTLRQSLISRAEQRETPFQRAWYSCPGRRLSKIPVEPIVKKACAVASVIGEMLPSNSTALFVESGEFKPRNLRNYAHLIMYCFFGLTGVNDLVIWNDLLPLPAKVDYFVSSVAFSIEGFLFYYHLHGRDELNVRLHTILFIVIFVAAVTFLLAAICDRIHPFLGFLKVYLLSLQGISLSQVGFVLYGPNPFAFFALALFLMYFICHVICYHICRKKNNTNDLLRN